MLSSLQICLSICLLVEGQSILLKPAQNIEIGESDKTHSSIYGRASRGAAPASAYDLQQVVQLVLRVRDENGVPVASAKAYLYSEDARLITTGETDFAGRVAITGISAGVYQIRVEKQGFYSLKLERVEAPKDESLDLSLMHEQEIRDSVDITNSPPAIDQTKTVASESIGAREIINIPYPTTRDFRSVLPFFPRVHRGSTGQVHINGSASYQVFYALDGFNISHPSSGLLELRVSPDAMRTIEVQSSRFSAEYGKASGGVLNLTTGMGDDRYRATATDFMPSVQFIRGFNLNSWTPRLAFSGPIRKGRAWFYSAADADVGLDIRIDLPEGADRNQAWRWSSLGKGQVNLSPTHLLNAGFLMNQFHSEYAGLSRFMPQGSAPELKQKAYLFTLKDQIFRANGLLIETGVAASQFRSDMTPHGDLAYQITPETTRGSFFKRSETLARRFQGLVNITLSPSQWRGRHGVKLGADVNQIDYERFLSRSPIQFLRADDSLSRKIDFAGSPRARRDNFEIGAYLQDRWAISNRLVVEAGIRFDRDVIVRRLLAAPRLAASASLTENGETRLAFGTGLFYDASNPDFITRPLEGRRLDRFFALDGRTQARQPVETTFILNERRLKAPRSFGWSMELERKLPAEIYLRAEWIGRRGASGYAFELQRNAQPAQLTTILELGNTRKDRYDAFSITARRVFKKEYQLFASYTRSSVRTNAALDFSLDTPIFSPQQGGPLDWDAPHRLISWGWTPLVKKFELAYSVDWRSGYPFSVLNNDRQLVEAPNSRRFPAYFSLNLHAERRFRLFGLNLALRAGFNNITNRQNAAEVNNNINSPQFLRFGSIQGRTFNGRIRFLGRK